MYWKHFWRIFRLQSAYETTCNMKNFSTNRPPFPNVTYCQRSKLLSAIKIVRNRSPCRRFSINQTDISSKLRDFTKQTNLTVDPFTVIQPDLAGICDDICKELKTENEEVNEIVTYFFDGQGKAIRPTTILLMSKLLNQQVPNKSTILQSQRCIAMIVEMIHIAALIHDDVIDQSTLRRGKPTINHIWGIKKAVFGSDYIVSIAATLLARIGNKDVISILSQVLVDLIQGEFMQLTAKEDEGERFTDYFSRIYRKTATIYANGCHAVAVLAGANEKVRQQAYQYGKNLGIAFQLIDDILDFESSDLTMGKPTSADLKLGIATAPVLFACQKFPELNKMILRRFSEPNDVKFAHRAVMESDGLEQSRILARQHCNLASRQIASFQDCYEKEALSSLAELVLKRNK